MYFVETGDRHTIQSGDFVLLHVFQEKKRGRGERQRNRRITKNTFDFLFIYIIKYSFFYISNKTKIKTYIQLRCSQVNNVYIQQNVTVKLIKQINEEH